MKTVKTFAQQLSFSLMMAMTLGSAIVSCGSILDEEDVDCSVEYRVKFKYDYNMKYADAFSREVGTVTLYAFDDNGKLVYQKMEEGDVLGEDGEGEKYLEKISEKGRNADEDRKSTRLNSSHRL